VLADESFFNVICPEQLFDVIMVLWTRHDLVVFFVFSRDIADFAVVGWVRTHAVFFIIMHLVL